MPAMLRSVKAEKMMWKILPMPANLAAKPTEKEKEIERRVNLAWIARQR